MKVRARVRVRVMVRVRVRVRVRYGEHAGGQRAATRARDDRRQQTVPE